MTLTETEAQQDYLSAAMSDAVQGAFLRAFANFKGTVHYSLKRSRGEYSTSDAEELGMHVQFDYAPDASNDEFVAIATDAIMRAKSMVYMGLGREVERDVNGIVMEANTDSLLNAFPGAVIEARSDVLADPADPTERPSTVDSGPSLPASPPYSNEDLDGMKGEPWKQARNANAAWAKELFDNGHAGDFWDNRDKKASGEFKSTSYDYTHKRFKHVGFWLPKARVN